ncbi:MAG: bifunctional 3-deoxy-7-phosphoheptulonate synthase/chorismate mutase [Planctomycetota bacterium]
MPELNKLREEIDQTDDVILKALAKRMDIVADILSLKEAEELPLFDANRERQMLDEVAGRAATRGLNPDLAKQVLQLVIRHSRRAQTKRLQEQANPMKGPARRVAYQGTEGAYSWAAAGKHFGAEVETVGFPTLEDALTAVSDGVVDQALLPIENTLAGSIHEVYDLLSRSSLHVAGEEVLEIEHCLIGIEAIPLERIRRVVSHPVALQQCTRFLRSLPSAECQAYMDTAEAVAKVKQDKDPAQVAIASRQAAEHYGLTILKEGIADHTENYTRFWVIDRTPVNVDVKVPAKTSLLLVTDHREGALVHCLQALAAFGINMTKLESRPIKETPWHYSFYLDLEGNLKEYRLAQALDRVRERARVVRILGCYPIAQRLCSIPPQETSQSNGGEGDVQGNGHSKDGGANGSNGSNKRTGEPIKVPMLKAMPVESDPADLHERSRRGKETVIDVAGVLIGTGQEFVVMAGPCAVETREQIMEAAALVKAGGARILRGGAYKPRTSPYSFQGLGAEGVKLLVEAGRAHGLPVVSEVLAPEQVEMMAECVDILQVGARNMQNYPLLRELGRCNRPVLLKRGMSATIDELLHAAEYILSGGNQQVILCERGIRTFDNAMRSTLDLGAVVVLKERTHLPVIVDPSHAAGKRLWVPPLARAARVIGCEGIIVEMHPEPAKARSDADQALSPEQFENMMKSIR